MKYLVRSIVLFICLGLGTTLAMASETTMKVGVIDWQQLLAKAPQAEEAGKRLEKEFQEPKEKLASKQKEMQTKSEKFKRDSAVMSVIERDKKQKELAKMEQDLRRADEEFRSNYSTAHREEMDKFIQTVREVVEKLAAEEKYDLVLPQEATLYIADRIDITSKVQERLEKSAKKKS